MSREAEKGRERCRRRRQEICWEVTVSQASQEVQRKQNNCRGNLAEEREQVRLKRFWWKRLTPRKDPSRQKKICGWKSCGSSMSADRKGCCGRSESWGLEWTGRREIEGES